MVDDADSTWSDPAPLLQSSTPFDRLRRMLSLSIDDESERERRRRRLFIPLRPSVPLSGARGRRPPAFPPSARARPLVGSGALNGGRVVRSPFGRRPAISSVLFCSRCKCNAPRRRRRSVRPLCVWKEGTQSARLLSVGAYEGRKKKGGERTTGEERRHSDSILDPQEASIPHITSKQSRKTA